MTLYEKLKEYGEGDYYPFHMPGHKRNVELMKMENPYGMDITEIDGFDDLHCADGILKEAMERAARLYSSQDTFFLINGSTVGILAGIAACTCHGDKIAIARNCHKSVYHGVFVNELQPVYLYPRQNEEWGISEEICPEDVDKLLAENTDVKLVVVTSPTYEGIVSDIGAIARIAHSYGVPLLVDEAHGAHFGFHPAFPKSSIGQGADIVVHSVHKTLPAFTQTALLHRNGSLVDLQQIKKYLGIYQTSSPSYLLMAGIDRCMQLLESSKEELFCNYVKNLEEFYEQTGCLKKIRFLRQQTLKETDLSKIVLLVKNTTMTGQKLYDILLHEFHLPMEMYGAGYVIAMTSLADTEEGFGRLASGLKAIDKELEESRGRQEEKSGKGKKEETGRRIPPQTLQAKVRMTPYEAEHRKGAAVSLRESKGRISKEYAYLYPPGTPVLAPGEEVTQEVIEVLEYYREEHLPIKGLQDRGALQIEVTEKN